jgi:hypothetical protein
MEGDGMKHCRKMKMRQQARLSSMGRKRDMVRWRGDVGWRRGSTDEEKGGDDVSLADENLTVKI